MLYPLIVFAFLLSFLIRKKYINLISIETIKKGHIILSNFLFVLALLLFSIETLSFIKIENENTTLSIRLILFLLLCFLPLYYINKLKAKKIRVNLCNSILSLSVIALAFLLYFSLKQPSLTIENSQFKINSFVKPIAHNLSSIDSVVLSNKPIKIKQKLDGFDFSGIYRGRFKTDQSKIPFYLYLNDNYSQKLIIYLKTKEVIIYNTQNLKELETQFLLLKRK